MFYIYIGTILEIYINLRKTMFIQKFYPLLWKNLRNWSKPQFLKKLHRLLAYCQKNLYKLKNHIIMFYNFIAVANGYLIDLKKIVSSYQIVINL